MALKLKRGPKDSVWVPVKVVHRDDNGKTYTDSFDALIRTPSETDDLADEGRMWKAHFSADADEAEGAARARIDDYISGNILDWRKLIDADDQPVPFDSGNLADLMRLVPYRSALLTVIGETRKAPAEPERKN